jgi:soluble lytic murein transglycosylase
LPLAFPPAPAANVVGDMPLPDANPNRGGALTPAIAAPKSAMDYESVLKPILSYDISSADEAYIRDVLRNGDSAAAKIKDAAARDFALWYKYRNGPATGNAEAIERFRLSHPDWPGQDELREKAETALFLTDAGPEEVKAFFTSTQPQTGAGKAALAGVRLKEGNQEAAKALVVSAWRDHRLNSAVESKILERYGSMLTTEHHKARIDQLLLVDDKSVAEPALRVAKLLPPAEKKKVDARIAVLRRQCRHVARSARAKGH